jgi:flagellar biosynthesis protein FlhB
MELEGKDGRTERATPRKRSQERNRGNMCISQEVTALLTLACGVLGVRLAVPDMYRYFLEDMRELFSFARLADCWTGKSVQEWTMQGGQMAGLVMAPILCGVLIGAVSGSMMQTKPYFSMGAFRMKLGGLNPVKGFSKLFSVQSAINMGLSLLKVMLIVFVAWKVLASEIAVLYMLPQMSGALSVKWVLGLVFKLVCWVLALFIVVALLDWIWKKRQYEKGIMMTKEEVKDEHKQQEVSPVVKRALSKRMRELSMLRMMSAVPNASVVITNPTHVAVALQYDPEKMDAPRVVAKGLRLVAERIKQVARKHNVPVIEKPELARAIYKSVKVGRQIPSNFYEAVATVLAYLHKLGRKAAAGRRGGIEIE